MTTFIKIVDKIVDALLALFMAVFQAGLILFGYNYAILVLTGSSVFPYRFHISTMLLALVLVVFLLIGNHKK